MRLFVTGSSGFVGSYIAKALRLSGRDVTCLTRSNYEHASRTYLDTSGGTSPRILVHCASPTPAGLKGNSYLNDLYSLNHFTEEVVNIIKPDMVIFLSSINACGKPSYDSQTKHQIFTEDTYTDLLDGYGAMKRAHEYFLRIISQSSRRHIIVLRLPAIVSNSLEQPATNFPLRLRNKFYGSEPIRVDNPDFLFNNMLHVDSLVACIDKLIGLCLASTLEKYTTLNLASTNPITIREVCNEISASTGVGFEQGDGTTNIVSYLVSVEKAEELGLPLYSTLRSVIDMLH